MEPCLGLTQGSFGQLSPIPGAQGEGQEKICFPIILSPPPGRLPSLPSVAWLRALGVCRRQLLVGCFGSKSWVWGPGFGSTLLSDPSKPCPLSSPDKMVSTCVSTQQLDNFVSWNHKDLESNLNSAV